MQKLICFFKGHSYRGKVLRDFPGYNVLIDSSSCRLYQFTCEKCGFKTPSNNYFKKHHEHDPKTS